VVVATLDLQRRSEQVQIRRFLPVVYWWCLSLRGFNLLVPDVGVNGNSAKLGTLTDCSCMLDIAVITSRWALF